MLTKGGGSFIISMVKQRLPASHLPTENVRQCKWQKDLNSDLSSAGAFASAEFFMEVDIYRHSGPDDQ